MIWGQEVAHVSKRVNDNMRELPTRAREVADGALRALRDQARRPDRVAASMHPAFNPQSVQSPVTTMLSKPVSPGRKYKIDILGPDHQHLGAFACRRYSEPI